MKIVMLDLLDTTPFHHWMDSDDIKGTKCRRIAVFGVLKYETAREYIIAPLVNSIGMGLQVVAVPKQEARIRQLKITKMECIKEVK